MSKYALMSDFDCISVDTVKTLDKLPCRIELPESRAIQGVSRYIKFIKSDLDCGSSQKADI